MNEQDQKTRKIWITLLLIQVSLNAICTFYDLFLGTSLEAAKQRLIPPLIACSFTTALLVG